MFPSIPQATSKDRRETGRRQDAELAHGTHGFPSRPFLPRGADVGEFLSYAPSPCVIGSQKGDCGTKRV
jgi:hypothetical protein